MDEQAPLTGLIGRVQGGDAEALGPIFAAAYEDLRRMARHRLSAGALGPLLDTTALVHESFLRFAGAGQLRVEDRAHFFRYAGQVTCSVIVDVARASLAGRRGSDAAHVTLNTAIGDSVGVRDELEILRVHEALDELGALDQRLVQVVQMRYFAGLTEVEIADSLGLTERTARTYSTLASAGQPA